MRELLHELDGGEHRLVVLVLVLGDHPVHEPVSKQRITAVEIDRGENVEDACAHTGDEGSGRGRAQDRQRRTVTAWVLERVVDVVEERVGRGGAHDVSEQPQLFVVADVGEVPHERRHQRGNLADEVGIVDRREEPEGARPRALQPRFDAALRVDGHAQVAAANWSGSGISVPSSCHASSRSSAGHRPRAT